jgi:rSAM/selenodomain-associated transferase 2
VDRDEANAIAVIIPVLNEAAWIAPCLAHLDQLDIAEIVVCDGGSSDRTIAIARRHDKVQVVDAARGRGTQLRAGIELARSPIVVLLHADTMLPPRADALIRAALGHHDVAGGCFRLRFDRPRASLAFSAWFSRFETALTTFGDQAFFMRRAALDEAGGIAEWPLLEDVDLRRRLKRVGRFVKLTACVTTSARRFERTGVLKGQLRNAAILAAFRCGASPQRLAQIYKSTAK